MITPIRGRKLKTSRVLSWFLDKIRNDNPDKGTETKLGFTGYICANRLEMITPIRGRKPAFLVEVSTGASSIRNDNPDKGTETRSKSIIDMSVDKIRNDNPDKGTETRLVHMFG